MAKKRSDFFGLGYIVSLILTIIPVTSWLCGGITRIMEGKIIAGIIRLIGVGFILWIADIVMMVLKKRIVRILNV